MKMTAEKKWPAPDILPLVPQDVPEDITRRDREIFRRITTVTLTPAQRQTLMTPPRIFPRQTSVLGVHWHPEFIPPDLITARLRLMFPAGEDELIIPTQHNELLSYGDYAGVEVDCWSRGFNRKVQLLIHMTRERAETAHRFKAMLAHTFAYRSSQLFEFLESLARPSGNRLEAAAARTGASPTLIRFVQIHARKLTSLLTDSLTDMPPGLIKNKLVRDFFDCLRPVWGDTLIDRVQTFVSAVKKQVKDAFSLEYFFRTSEVIEEARALNAGIVIPHPEQFWPILLADYDVDGVEVWNPQSQRYTDFLISVIREKNRNKSASDRPLLVFMGDDTHFGEKVRDPDQQDPVKTGRELGYQPPWDDPAIAKTLVMSGITRERVITEYRHRLC